MQSKEKSIEHEFWHTSTGVWKIILVIVAIVIILLSLAAKFSNTDDLIEYGNLRTKAPHYTWFLAGPSSKYPTTQMSLSTKHQIKFPKSTNNPEIYINHKNYHIIVHHYKEALNTTHLTRTCHDFKKLDHNDKIFKLHHDNKYFLLIQEHRIK